MVTAGGPVEHIAPVGPASVPGLGVTSPVALALAVWPFPLEPAPFETLTSLGYEPVKGFEGEPEQRFFNLEQDVQLHVVAAGNDRYTRYVLVRDFLRASAGARARFPEQGATPDLLNEAERWWVGAHGFSSVEAVADAFRSLTHPWLFSSGWALDIFLGRVTRVHHDVDVVVPRAKVQAVREHLDAGGWELVLPLGGRLEPWPPGSPLAPDIQIHAHRDGAFIDLLLTEMTEETWTYRRKPSITCPAGRAFLRTADGLPYLAPELVLLFKSKNTSVNQHERPQDEGDFNAVLPQLSAEQRNWLREALGQTDPAHPWRQRL